VQQEKEREYAQQRIDELKEIKYKEEQEAREYQMLIQEENKKALEANEKKLHLSTFDRKKLKKVSSLMSY
jgi:hypothetical protein